MGKNRNPSRTKQVRAGPRGKNLAIFVLDVFAPCFSGIAKRMRVDDILPGYNLTLSCYVPGCGVCRTLSREAAIARYGEDVPLERLRRAATCGTPGHRGAHLTISREGPAGYV